MEIVKRVMIVGPHRSGTTLTHHALSAHPDFWSHTETHYYQFLLRTDARRFLDRLWIPP